MYSKPGTTIALLMGAFPFLALGFKLFEASAFSGIIYALILLALVAGIAIASRIDIVLPEPETADAARAARPPAPPIRWSWDGVDRQPGDEAPEASERQSQAH